MKTLISWLYHKYNKNILEIHTDRIQTIESKRNISDLEKRNMPKKLYQEMILDMEKTMELEMIESIKEFVVTTQRTNKITRNTTYSKKINIIKPIRIF